MKHLNVEFMSMAGSYMAITKKTDDELRLCENLMLRSLHGISKNKNCWDVCEFIPYFQNSRKIDEINYFKSEISSKTESMKITFADENTLVVMLKNCGLCIDFKFKSKSDYLLRISDDVLIFNSYKSSTKYILKFVDVHIKNIEKDKMVLNAGDGYIFIKETFSNMDSPFDGKCNFEDYESNMKENFIEFSSKFISNENWEETLKYAHYIIWSSIVSPKWMIKNDTVLTSNYKFTCAWGFDSLFVLLGLIKYHPELAKQQLKNFMDSQDELGMIPGSLDDSSYRFNFAKPPGQGLFIKKILQISQLSLDEKKKIFYFLDRLTRYWLDKKDSNHDGICEYLHGNESCQDNSTQFDESGLVDSAELYGYILNNIDVLILLASELGHEQENQYWRNVLEAQKELLDYFIKDYHPVSRLSVNKKIIESQSVLPYMILLANEHLNQDLKNSYIEQLKNNFIGCCGITTEALNSSKFEEDGYFRGSVFPYEMLLVDAIEECGCHELAHQIAESYCICFKEQGSYECFNAKTGVGQREGSYTSTAAMFLYLFDKYIN